ncbi:MAG: CDP-diacylglycerol--glycerol-3-phosphate 3-phosphatidyltransferase [Terriglobia bacterium]
MSLPNSLTLLRIFFVPLLVVLLLTNAQNMDLWAVGVFIAAAITDLLDGYFARRQRQVSRLGILLDPIADKLLVSSAFISLVALHLVPAWIVVIIIGRELAVSGLRAVASAEGYIIPASELGKSKMVFEVIAITVIALVPRFPRFDILGQVLLWLVVWFALASAAQYFWHFWRKLEERDGPAAPRMVVIRGGEDEAEKKKDAAAQ